MRHLSLILIALAGVLPAVNAGNYVTNGAEYPIAGRLLGDQVNPQLSFGTTGGFLVWEDNFTDGVGKGISARRLDQNLTGAYAPFRVNQEGLDDQENAQVSLLPNGGAAFTWQGGKVGFQHIYARFLGEQGFMSGDILVGSSTGLQINPRIVTLKNGNVVITWNSVNQVSSNSLQDVYAQIFTPAGAKVGSSFLVNQFTSYNQRSAEIAPLADGGFIISWVSEQQSRSGEITENMLYPRNSLPRPSVDIYARLYSGNGGALGNEFIVNSGNDICATPDIAVSADGNLAITWMALDSLSRSNSWDIYVRPISAGGAGGNVRRVNTVLYGDQLGPQISASGTDYLIVYTSLGHDGSREGVYGQYIKADGSPIGTELRINTTTPSQQIHPSVAADNAGRFLVTWTSYTGSPNNFDLFAQRYADTGQALSAPDAPIVTVISSNALSVTWPSQAGFEVANYEVYADGALTATAVVAGNQWTLGGLAPASTHSVRIAYVLADGRKSPHSAAGVNTTYSAGATWGGIPQEWMIASFGPDMFNWPSPYADTDNDGASNYSEFLAGTNPQDSASVLKARIETSDQGLRLHWNTEPNLVYQVQTSSDLQQWSNLGQLHFSTGQSASMPVTGNNIGIFRVIRLR